MDQDHLGTLRVKTDSTGAVKCRYWYYPYGELQSTSCSETDVRKFTDKERDPETGLDYFGARHYASDLGRFTSTDIPGVDQQVGDPQSWNLFNYVRNNPLRYFDPTGRKCVKLDDGSSGDDGQGEACAEVEADEAKLRPSVTVTGEKPPVLLNDFAFRALTGAARQAERPVTLMGYGLLAFTGTSTFVGAGGFAANLAVRSPSLTALGVGGAGAFNLSAHRLQHVINRHTVGGIKSAGKHFFCRREHSSAHPEGAGNHASSAGRRKFPESCKCGETDRHRPCYQPTDLDLYRYHRQGREFSHCVPWDSLTTGGSVIYMGINIQLETAESEPIDQILDPRGLLKSMFPRTQDPSFPCLGVVDPYGDTVFNYLQMDALLSELRRVMVKATSDEERVLLERIETLAVRCSHERLLLRFVGD